MPPLNDDEPLADSVETACARLGISRPTFYREVQAGRLRVRKMAHRALVERAEQRRWLESLPVIDGSVKQSRFGR
jgi:excisionase family DNA binding protein